MSFSHKINASFKLMCENVILPNGLIINLMKNNGQELNNLLFCNCTFSSFSHRSTTKWCQLKIHIENTEQVITYAHLLRDLTQVTFHHK